MKKFKFTFQTLLNISVALEKEQKNKLAIINNQLHVLEDTRDGINKNIRKLQEEFSVYLTINEFINGNNYLCYLKDQLEDINIRISEKEEEKKEMQRQLIETMTQRKTYEKLRKKQLEIYKKELAIEDDKSLSDFIASNGGE